jgi:hypothetical protein
MSVKIGKYEFEGPYTSTDQLKDQSGVYVVLCQKNPDYSPVDCGESATVKSRVENHDRSDCWSRNCSTALCVAVLYTSESERFRIEQEIRSQYSFPCGVR